MCLCVFVLVGLSVCAFVCLRVCGDMFARLVVCVFVSVCCFVECVLWCSVLFCFVVFCGVS